GIAERPSLCEGEAARPGVVADEAAVAPALAFLEEPQRDLLGEVEAVEPGQRHQRGSHGDRAGPNRGTGEGELDPVADALHVADLDEVLQGADERDDSV